MNTTQRHFEIAKSIVDLEFSEDCVKTSDMQLNDIIQSISMGLMSYHDVEQSLLDEWKKIHG